MEFPSLLTLLGIGLGLVVVLLLILYWWIRPYPLSKDLPGPKRNPWLGVTFSNESKEILQGDGNLDWGHWPTLGLNLSRQYGFRTWGGPSLNIGFGPAFFNIVSTPCLEYILKENNVNYVKGKLVKSFDELLGSAVFTTDGELWKWHRRFVVDILNRETVQHGATLLRSKLQVVETYLSSKEGQIVDMQDLAYKMIFDVFIKLAFGVELDQVQDKPERNLQDFVQAFTDLQCYTHLRFADLLWEIRQRFGLGERERKVRQCKKVIDKFAYSVIKETRQRADLMDRKDVVSRFLQYCREANEQEPSEKELRDFVMTLVMAGRDTTAATIAWTLWELTSHPVYVDSIREEVDRVGGLSDAMDLAMADKLPFVKAVVMESLRLHCPAPELFRFSVADDTLPDGTFVPAGSCVMYSPYSINHSEKVWGHDADDFKPERWLGQGEPSPFRFPTFNAGPRTCPGRQLALTELKLAIAYLVCKFDFEDLDGHTGEYRWTLVMAMKDGFRVRVHRRK